MISFSVDINDRALRLHLEELPRRLQSRLTTAIRDIVSTTRDRVRATEPGRRTGTGELEHETQWFVDVSDAKVRGRVRILGKGREHNAAAGALEYGSHRAITVKQHQMHVSQVFGHEIARRSVTVRAYERHTNIRAYRMLRDPAQAMRPRAQTELEHAITEAVR